MAGKRKCACCGVSKPKEQMVIIGLKAFIDYDHATKYGVENRAKGKAIMEKAERKVNRERKEANLSKNLSHQKESARKRCNEMVRLLDHGEFCIDGCGRVCIEGYHAGHFKSVGSHPEHRFDPRNIHGQNGGCNTASERRKSYQKTVSDGYDKGLVERYGQELYDFITGPHPLMKLNCEELIAMREVFTKETTRLKNGEPPTRNWRQPGLHVMELVLGFSHPLTISRIGYNKELL